MGHIKRQVEAVFAVRMPITARWRLTTCLVACLLAALAPRVLGQRASSIYSFTGGSDGEGPRASLIQAADGNLYGTTYYGGIGGTGGPGTVFKITPGGAFTTLYSFTGGSDGANPNAGLIQAADGNLYGTTSAGGTSKSGTVFKIAAGGALTTLYSFTGGSDGGVPYAGLIQAVDGSLYGTTSAGGTINSGTVFKIATGGALTTLYSFTGGPDGGVPYAGLIQAADGSLYGTTSGGGTGGAGTVFKITTGGTLTTLY
ncbi:MAG TPA: choice-of-anchor tandem repeat GloVer-containing protein, partial [Chthonomonadales bacterium]|nr:choice-of-anchor tandem repeat GloVer-containing protein [Chthonomonadales bacterium]